MKSGTEFGPWTMSAYDRRFDSFWKQRFHALQSGHAKRSSRRYWLGLALLLVLMVAMPSWQLGEQTATAEERPLPGVRLDPIPSSTPSAMPLSSIYVAEALPGWKSTGSRPWQLVDSPQLPDSNKITLMEGQRISFKLPDGGSTAMVDDNGVFAAFSPAPTAAELTLDSTAGDGPAAQVEDDRNEISAGGIVILGLKSGVGKLKFDTSDGRKDEFQIVVVSDPAPLQTKLDKEGLGEISITPGVQSVTLSGNVPTPEKRKQCLVLADELYPHVVNNIQISNELVQLHCRIFEFKTTEAELDGVLKKLFAGGERQEHDKGIYSSVLDDKAFERVFNDMRKAAKAEMLAEPVLTTVSGRPAAFKAGGEFPILIPQGPGTVAVEYKQFGTRVDLVPLILNNGRIRLEVRPQVTQLMGGEDALKVDGLEVPRLKQRWVDFACEMWAGQTMTAVLVHKNEKGKTVGFVTTVRPEFVASMSPDEVPLFLPSHPSATPSAMPPAAARALPRYTAPARR